MTKKPVNPSSLPIIGLGDTVKIPKQPLYTHRVITCAKCGQPGGTLIKVGDNEYVHQRQSGCN